MGIKAHTWARTLKDLCGWEALLMERLERNLMSGYNKLSSTDNDIYLMITAACLATMVRNSVPGRSQSTNRCEADFKFRAVHCRYICYELCNFTGSDPEHESM